MAQRAKKWLKLTPKLYRELDIIARAKAGTVIEIIPHDRMEFGACALIPGGAGARGFHEDITQDSHIIEKRCIELANQIDLGRISYADISRLSQTGLNLGAIPEHLAYHYLIHHEVGHLLLDLDGWKWLNVLPLHGPIHGMIKQVNEYRADEYAWQCLFGETPMPVQPGSEERRKQFEAFLKKYRKYFPEAPRKIEPLDTNPLHFVPSRHFRQGIPWASGVRANPFPWYKARLRAMKDDWYPVWHETPGISQALRAGKAA